MVSDTLALKLILTPLLVGAVSLASRRWGPAIGGWLVGLPLNSGPIVLYLALEQGRPFAARAAAGILAGTLSIVVFCFAYSWLAFRCTWWCAALITLAIFFACTWSLQFTSAPAGWWFVAVLVALTVALALWPRAAGVTAVIAPPRWEIPARMVAATAFIVLITTLAPLLGSHLSGLLATFPTFASTLAVFTHHFQGAPASAQLLRGTALGLFAFASFFLVLATTLEQGGLTLAFIAATALTLAVQGGTLWVMGRVRVPGSRFGPRVAR